MATQGQASFGDALRPALHDAGISQAELARELNINQGQVSRWINGRAVPHIDNIHRIEAFLKVDLSDAFAKATPKYELFVSAPISGIASKDVPAHHDAVAKVVAAVRQHVNDLSWPGDRVRTAIDRQNTAPDIATAHNMRELYGCPAFLYLQFAELIGPSSALVELGFALGRRMKVTIIYKRGLTSPYMLRGFGGVAAKLPFLPDTRIYEEESADSAAALIASNGRELLGLA